MGADSTLVTAAFKEAETRAGAAVPNMKPLYDSNRTIGTEPFKAIKGLVDQVKASNAVLKSGRTKQFGTFKEAVKKMYKSINTDGNNLSDDNIAQIEASIKQLQDEFEAVNTYGNNDNSENEKARYRIEGKLNKIIKGAVNTRKDFNIIGDLIEHVNEDAVSYDDLEAMTLIVEAADNDDDERVTKSMGEDFQVLYTVTIPDPDGGDPKVTTMNISQMREKFPMKLPEVLLSLSTGAQSSETRGMHDGKTGNYDFNLQEEITDIRKIVKSKKEFQSLSENSDVTDSAESFADALYDDIALQLEVIQPMFTDKDGNANGLKKVFTMLDKNNDNKIDEADEKMATEFPELFKENLKQLVNAIAFVNNENFDLEVSTNLLATYYANNRKELYDMNYKAGHKKGGNAVTLSPSAVAIIPGYDKKTKGREVRINYQNFQEGNTITHYNNIDTYEKNANGWLKKIPEWDDTTDSASTTNFKDEIQMTDEQVAKELGFFKYRGDLNYDPKIKRGSDGFDPNAY